MALTEKDIEILDGVVEDMEEDFADICAKNEGDDLSGVSKTLERNLECTRYLLKRAYERHPEVGNRLPLYLAMHTSKNFADELLGVFVKEGPNAFWHALAGHHIATLYSSVWNDMQKDIVEEELSNL